MKEAMENNAVEKSADATAGLSRRRFLTFASGVLGASALIAACNKDDDSPAPASDGTIDIGANDTGLLNLLFALQQIEAAFYEQVFFNEFIGMTADERTKISEIRNHEITHREFFRNLLGSNGTELEVEFPRVRFTDKNSVLENAKLLEDLNVAALNGMATLMVTPDFLTLVGKMASVEARHAVYVSELIAKNTFDNTTDPYGMEPGNAPNNVIAVANNFLKTKISGKNLPS
ncbi:MAG: ferritin-like domain-containing protein [Flavipsychrobacter sp.]